MKLGAFITIYDGLELLPKCIENLKKQVDFILLIWQDVSNTGNTDKEVGKYVEGLCGWNVHSIKFEPNLYVDAKLNELNKHNQAIEFLKSIECTHFIALACDHFYTEEQFEYGRWAAKAHDVTLSKMFTYYKHPTWQLTPPEDYYMPFICRLYDQTKFINLPYKYLTDPSVRINMRNSVHAFREDELMMHHYSMIRQDITKKIYNSASYKRWGRELADKLIKEYNDFDISTNKPISYFDNRIVKEVPNYFNL